MHVHLYTRSERVRPDIFLVKTESVKHQPYPPWFGGLQYFQGADRVEPLVGFRVVVYRSVCRAPLLVRAEEDVNIIPDWVGCCLLRSEFGDVLSPECILMVISFTENLGDLMEPLDGGIV